MKAIPGDDERASRPPAPVARMGSRVFARLEAEISRIAGVRTARIIGDDAPREIHVVADTSRSPKQLVRDIQSLSSAGFGISIDHRIVSVVQLAEEGAAEVAVGESHRPALDRIVFAQKGDRGWVRVGLTWPDGSSTEGTGAAGSTRDARARAAVQAVQRAIEPVLEMLGAAIDVEQVLIQQTGPRDSVLVHLLYFEDGVETPLVGSAIVPDDVASAAARAMLQALNRKLS